MRTGSLQDGCIRGRSPQGRPARSGRGPTRGSVLILALWTLFFLSALALAVGARVSVGLSAADRLREDTVAYAAACAGVEKACFVIGGDTNGWDGFDEAWAEESGFREVSLGGGVFTVSHEWESEPGRIIVRYGAVDEESKINLNKVGRHVIEALLEVAGGADPMTAQDVSASICDWRDPDHDALTGGAEASYYAGLTQPYTCPDRDLESLQELLLVKGMTSALYEKIKPHATVYGAGKVNVNTAGATVLKTLAYASGAGSRSVCDGLVVKLAAFRNGGGVFREATAESLKRQLASVSGLTAEEESVFSSMLGMIALRSSCFGGISSGRMNGRSNERRVAFVFDRQAMTKLSWHED